MKENKFTNIPEADVVVKHINSRFKKGLNTNIFIIGLSGSGKSSTSQRVGEIVIESRPKENIKMTCVDSLLGLLEAIRNSNPGDIIVIEEVSVLFPSRRAMAKDNLAVGKIFDTVRKRMLCIISNAPLWNSIDGLMKSQGHILIETKGIKKQEGIVISKFWRLQTNPATGKCYKHTMTRGGKEIPLMITRMPDKSRWEDYENQKDAFMDFLYRKLRHEQVKKLEKEAKEMGLVKPKIRKLTKRELEVHQLRLNGMKNVEIARELGINNSRITRIIQNINKKSEYPKELAIIDPKIPLLAPNLNH